MYNKGDKVLITETGKQGIVFSTQDDRRNVVVLVDDELVEVYEKRLKLQIARAELYPEDYDLDSLFISFKERKLEKDIARGSKKALKQIQKQIRGN